jgi:hypothetical protein
MKLEVDYAVTRTIGEDHLVRMEFNSRFKVVGGPGPEMTFAWLRERIADVLPRPWSGFLRRKPGGSWIDFDRWEGTPERGTLFVNFRVVDVESRTISIPPAPPLSGLSP